MKRYYRNRIMFSAILSFLIVLVIAVAGILLLSYYRLERNSDSFIASKLVPREEDGSRYIQDTPPEECRLHEHNHIPDIPIS